MERAGLAIRPAPQKRQIDTSQPVYMNTGTAEEVEIDFAVDTSFMISAVC